MKSPWFRLAVIVPVLGLFVGCGGGDTTPPTAPSFDTSALKDETVKKKSDRPDVINNLTN